MDIQKELVRLQRDIAESLRIQANAEQAAADANRAYDKALAEWEAQNPVLAQAKQLGADAKADAKKQLDTLREEARNLLGNVFIEDLPEGFNQKHEKVVILDPQGFLQQARENFPFLLKVDVEAAEKFFKAMAIEQPDGAFIIPEHIRRWANVEVVIKPKPEISDAKLGKLSLDAPEETEPLSAITQAIETVEAAEEAWTPPANAIAILTAPELPEIDGDYSSEGESLPMNSAFNEDGTWKNASLWDAEDEPQERELAGAFKVPDTKDIDF